MADEKPSDEKSKFDPFKPSDPSLPGIGPEHHAASPKGESTGRGSSSGQGAQVTAKWTSPAGKFFNQEATAHNVSEHGGLLVMKVVPLVAQTIQLTSKATGQTAEARVVNLSRAKDGTVQGVNVEFPAPLASFWGAQDVPAASDEQPLDAAPQKMPAVVARWIDQAKASPKQATAIGGGAVVLMVVVLWLAFGSSEPPPAPAQQPSPAPSAPAKAPATADGTPTGPPPDIVTLPATVATTQEMSRAWAYKKFIIRRFGNRIPAMVLRIPVASAGSSSGYWGFTLETSSGRCELEVVTDLNKLASDYGYRARHPMVVDPCTQTVFDPMGMGSIGPNTYTRGEVVRGTALRPPIAIDIRVQRGEVVAVRTE